MAENVGGKWDPLGGCSGESGCVGVLRCPLLVAAGFGPARVSQWSDVKEFVCHCVEVAVCCS